MSVKQLREGEFHPLKIGLKIKKNTGKVERK